jgi:predicted small lipoprotein YifL
LLRLLVLVLLLLLSLLLLGKGPAELPPSTRPIDSPTSGKGRKGREGGRKGREGGNKGTKVRIEG